MSTPKDGGPAFPNMAPNSCGPHIAKRDGMTLRDYFAGQALAGICANPDISESAASQLVSVEDCRVGVSRSAYALADAMLAQRETP